MDRRTLLALVLMAIVIVVTPMLFSPKRAPAPTVIPDSAAIVPASPKLGIPTAESLRAAPQPTTPIAAAPSPALRAESLAVAGSRAQTVFVNPGAAPAFARVTGHRNLRPGSRDTAVVVAQTKGPLLHYRLLLGADTIPFESIPFTVATNGNTTTFTSASPAITLTYQPIDGLRTAVRGTIANAPAGSM